MASGLLPLVSDRHTAPLYFPCYLNAFSKELSLSLVLGNFTIVTSHDEKPTAVLVTAASKPAVARTQLYAVPAS